jgi:hypothetical protein
MMRVRVLIAMEALQQSGMRQQEARDYINTEYPKLRGLMTRGKDLPSTITRWRRDLDEAKKGTFLASFAQLNIEMSEEMRINSALISMTPDSWRQTADNMLARIQP